MRWRFAVWLGFLLLALAFGISYAQYPLYYFTQNQYFFHGLARAGYGLLRHDWLAGTADPWPVFSLLVELTNRYMDQRAFYVYYILLLGIYAYSLLGIASSLFGIDRSRLKFVATLALLTGLHSPVFAHFSTRIFGFDEKELLTGVALQRILWDMLHPGAFGVFLLLSICLFLRGKHVLAVVSAAVAATFHPAYILSAGVLSGSYVVITLRREEGRRKAWGLALCALGCLLPVAAYMAVAFRPTSPEVWKEAQAILVRALARHTVPAEWLDSTVVLKVGMVLAALYLVRRTELFWIMLLSLVAAVGLTIVQMISGSDTLALLYPWRLSVYLVPLSTVMIATYLLSRVLDGFERRFPDRQSVLVALSVVTLIVLVAAGALETARRRKVVAARVSTPTLGFVKATKAPEQTYLIPVNWRYFRLFTGAPAFVDDAFIPYDDVAVLEWSKRLRLAEAFYRASGDRRCRLLQEMSAGRPITHVVLPKSASSGCNDWKLAFEDGDYRLYRVTP